MTGIVGLAPVAQASSAGAEFLIKGTGSVYTPAAMETHVLLLPDSPGSSVSFAVKLVNTGTSTAQFKLLAGDDGGGTPTWTVAGVTANGLIDTNDGYYTPAIAAGKSIAITVKMTLNNPRARFFNTEMEVWSSDGSTLFDGGSFYALAKAPSAATGPDQIFVKNGSSAYVGGPDNVFGAEGPALAPGASTTFTAHVVNGGNHADVIQVAISDKCTNYAIDVKAGSADVTTAVLGGTYRTSSLAAGGGHQDLTVKVTYRGIQPGVTCDFDHLDVDGQSLTFPVPASDEFLFVNPAA
jgi:hypothetical protein